MDEELKNYLKNYKVFQDGSIYSYYTDRFIKTQKNSNGYITVNLWNGESTKKFRVHRLVALTYIDNPENKSDVNHKNGDKSDNRVRNLEWNTRKENMQHSFNVLKNQTKTKLTKEQVIEIRKLSAEGYKQRALAKMFSVRVSCICDIVNYKLWKYA